jgi:gliding motility-associated-like protein
MKNFPLQAMLYSLIALAVSFGVSQIENETLKQSTFVNLSFNKSNMLSVAPPSGSISGSTAVCKDESSSPEVTFTGSNGTAPYTFTYTINSGANLTITTTNTDNSVSVSQDTSTSGSFIYQLISISDSSGDSVNISQSATVLVAEATVDFSFDNNNTCSGTSINFTSNVSGNDPFEYNWSFGDGATSTAENPSYSYEALGCGTSNYDITLTITNAAGCTDTITKSITVLDKPDIDFKDANFSNPAQYFNNCSNTSSDETLTITVENISSSTCVTGYVVDWGDGSSEPFNTPTLSHTYTYSDTFRMDITGTGSNGCIHTKTYIVKNASNPQGNIVSPGGTQNLCAPAEIAFTISSNWGANSIDTVYEINYGDGTVMTFLQEDMITTSYYNASDPTASSPFPIPHTYSTSNCPSDFEATILISNSCATTPGNSGGIRILKNATANFDVDGSACVNTAVDFENTSDTASAFDCSNFIEFTWDFGDGSPVLITYDYSNVSHTYLNTGNYTASLTANNGICDSTTYEEIICVEQDTNPTFNVDSNNDCSPLPIQITNTTDLSLSCGGETYLWDVIYTSGLCATGAEQWSFTDGTDENSASPSFNFITAGTYTLELTFTNSCGTQITTETIEVKQPPTAQIDVITDVCGTATISPTATIDTCAPASETVTYAWSFPGGSPSSANTLGTGMVTYTTPGDYTISFSITTSCGTVTDTEEFSINPIPTLTNTNLTQTICSGTDTAEVILTSDLANTTYSWTASAPASVSGFVNSGTTDNIPSQNITNSNSTSEDVTFVITPSLNGCNGTPVNLVITVDPAPAFTSQPISETICENGSVSALSVSVSGAGTPNYQWYSNSTNDNSSGTEITGETNATYTPPNTPIGITYYYCLVSFSSGTGCSEITSDTASIEIVNGIQIDTQPQATQSICNGGSISSALSATHSGGTGTVNYQWYTNVSISNTGGSIISGATNIDYTPPTYNSPGNYYYYLIISLNGSGCSDITSDVAEVIVVDDPIITNQPTDSQTLCQGITPQNLEVTATGGIGSTYNYQWYSNTTDSNSGGTLILGETGNTFTPPTTTVGTIYYYSEITQSGIDCSVTSNTSELIINPAPAFTTQPISNTYCLGDTLNQLSVSYSDGVGTPSYQWYANTTDDTTSGAIIPGETSANFTPSGTTVGAMYYYVIITFNSGGCTLITSNTAEIVINQTPDISSKTSLICSGNTFTVSPDNSGSDVTPTGTTYTWANPVINPAGTITGASSENTAQNNISQTLTNTTTNPSTVTYTVTPTSGICIGNTFTVTITINPSITISSTLTNSNCYNANSGEIDIAITGGIPFSTGNPYQISWSGPNGFSSNTEDVSNLEPGNYTLNMLDDGGCPFTEIFTISEPDELIFSSIDFDPETISCFGANDGNIGIEISGGTAPHTYSWTKNNLPFSTSKDIDNLEPGVYEITVVDANSCTPITQEFDIIEPAILDVNLSSQTNILCFGDATGEININTTGGRPIEISTGVFDYNYTWQGPNGFTSTNQNLTGLYAGTYNLIVTDKSNCTDTLEVILTESDDIIIAYTATEIKCYGDNDASINIDNISGGNAPYSIAWSNLGSGYSQTNLSPGTYIITVTDDTNCEKEATVIIDDVPVYEITPAVTQVSCFGANDARIVLNLVGGIDPVDLVWDDDPTAGVERNNIGPGTYSVTITDGTPCVLTETFTITEPDELTLSANTTDALDCDNSNSGAINLIVTGGTLPLTYSWSNGDITEDLTNIPPGDYSVTVTDANGCDVSESWIINRFEPLEIEVTTETDVDCDAKTINQSFIAQASGGVPPYSYAWSSGTVSGNNGEIMTTTFNGLFFVEVTDAMGCITNFSYNVEIPVLGDPDFDITSNALNNFGFYSVEDSIYFSNTSTGSFTSVSWDFGDGTFSNEENPEHTYFSEGNYTVIQTVIYPSGCVYYKNINLEISKGYSLMMPNAFTPNGDSMNPYFVPKTLALSEFEFNIFDTWGSLIYSENGDNLRGWDGKIKSNDAENGNYYFTLKAKTIYGKTISEKGKFVSIK